MKLVAAQITNFRCAEDTEEFSIGPVTCLVGKNESGKTTVLQALSRLNAHPRAAHFDRVLDYPRRHLSDYETRHSGRNATVVKTKWTLDDHDYERIRKSAGPQAAEAIQGLLIEKHYDDEATYWTVEGLANVDERKLIEHLCLANGVMATDEQFASITKLDALHKTCAAAAQVEANAKLRDWLDKSAPKRTIHNVITSCLHLPAFLYFSTYDRMQGRVPLEQLHNKTAQKQPLTSDEQLFIDFCEFAGTSLPDLIKIQQFEALRARFEAASNKITDRVFEYWTQNPNLRVEFSRDAALPGDPPPFNTGTVFNIRIRNDLHGVTVSFNERSAGFVWFFSFLVAFSQVTRRLGNNVIILLDEPGLNLHGKAQQDLLRFIDSELAPKHQVIYTTHSPFLVPTHDLSRVRVVEDVVVERPRKPPQVLGTKVRESALGMSDDTLFPLQAALGYDICQSLFVGKNTLIVEGPSDLLYLNAFSRELSRLGRAPLDKRWVICPVGGIDKVPAFLALFGANHLNVTVLCDIAHGTKKKTAEIKTLTDQLLKTGRVLHFAMYTGGAEADIEDMLGPTMYPQLVNEVLKPTPSLTAAPAGTERVVKWVESEMRTRGEFDHYQPAAYLTSHPDVIAQLPGVDHTMARFERLFLDLAAVLK